MNMRASIDAAQTSGPLEPGDGAMAFAFRFAANDPAFAGHFPTRPLLPGVFQLEMARRAAEAENSSDSLMGAQAPATGPRVPCRVK